ncbi:MAG: ATP-binding protein [Ferruginibacter sp.]
MEYNLEYLKSLIENKVEESLNLDYKSAGALEKQNNKTTEISKDISALANSDGGIIIYGIKEDNEQKHIPSELDTVKRKEFSKEWLEQIINEKIRPRIEKFKIYPVSITDEDVIYIVEVSKGTTAHQADDKRYYKRYNFQSVPMYDYEIRDILNRSKHPKLSLVFEFKNLYKSLIIYILNSGSVFANYVNVKITVPNNVIRNNNFVTGTYQTWEIFADNTVRDILDTQYLGPEFPTTFWYGPSRYEPILPTRKFKLVELELLDFVFDYENIIKWEIYCDNSEPVADQKRFNEIVNT